MKLTVPQWLGVVLLSLVVLARVNVQPTPPTPTPDAPSAELQAAVAPVGALLKGHADAPKIAAYCQAVAQNLARSDCPIKTTGQLRQSIITSVPLMFPPGTKGGPPGLAAAMNAVLTGQLGLDDVEFDKAKAAATFHALAWSASDA